MRRLRDLTPVSRRDIQKPDVARDDQGETVTVARHGDFDQTPLDRDDRESLEKRDHETLGPVMKGDARGWFDQIRREKDRRRVCGLTPMYTVLRVLGREGKLLKYGQAPDPNGTVTFASVVF